MSATSRRPATWGAVLAFALVALLGGLGLVVAGASERRTTAFSLDVPITTVAATMKAGSRLCQGPIAVSAAAAGVRIWIAPVGRPGASLRVVARSAGGSRLVASGYTNIAPSAGLTIPVVRFNHPVARGTTISLCLTNTGHAPIPLAGSTPGAHSGVLQSSGESLGSAATMIFVSPHSTSLLSSLPTVFDRASLFRPTWMHPWVYWVLVAGLLVAAGLVGVGIAAAARADQRNADTDADSNADTGAHPV
ncbi:MAG: hypothetical protein WAK93_01315 [Solirubrobacteraceae bacterium]